MTVESTYLRTLFLFKVAVGALLLLVGWDALDIKGDSIFNITLLTGLAFVPAAFAKPLYYRLSHFAEDKITKIGLLFAAIFVLIEMLILSKQIYFFAVVHFILWTIIFLIEVSLERWFVLAAKGLKTDEIKKLSGLSMTTIQLAIVIGPVIVALVKGINAQAPYVIISLLFIFGAFISKIQSSHNSNSVQSVENLKTKTSYLFAFALIWPTLSVFNMIVPIMAKFGVGQSINVAAAFEVAVALGSATAGYLVSNKFFKLDKKMGFVLVLATSILITLFYKDVLIAFILIFLLGIGYGLLRVLARQQLGVLFSPLEAGKLIATANALSSPFVVLFLALSYFEYHFFKTIFTFSLSFICSGLLFLYILREK